MSVNDAVLRDMIRVQDLQIHISYPEFKSRKFLRNVGRVTALTLVATTQKTITIKYVSCLIFGCLCTNSSTLIATKPFETSHLITSHFTVCGPCVVTHNINP